jgi:hypothetical protein
MNQNQEDKDTAVTRDKNKFLSENKDKSLSVKN